MTLQLNTTVDRPITDLRHMTSVLRSKPILHGWTLIQSKAYTDPETGFPKILPRVGTVGLPAQDAAVEWTGDGAFQVAHFTQAGGTGKYSVTIPNPGNVFTVIEIATPESSGDMATWGMEFATNALTINSCIRGGGSIEPVGTKLSINGRSNMAGSVVAPAENARGAMATVFDLTNSNVARSVDGDAFTVLQESGSSTIADLVPQPDATITLNVGWANLPSNIDAFTGKINDLFIYGGDLRNDIDLWDAIVAYGNSAYGA